MKPALHFAAILIMSVCALAVPQLMNYQGYLTDPSGSPSDTSVAMTFRLYDAPGVGANLLWIESQPAVAVQSGLFSTQLGSITALPDSLLNHSEVWLSITIGNNSEMNPRTRITSVAYSQRVGTVDGATGGTISGGLAVGFGNVNTGEHASVFGQENETSGTMSFVAGGFYNHATADVSSVIGGNSNTAQGTAAISGGADNMASGNYACTIGGGSNTASGYASFTGGGQRNQVSGQYACVVGGGGYFPGEGNAASGDGASIIGGRRNSALGLQAVVAGGDSNIAAGDFSFAGGRRAYAGPSADGSFVWADASGEQMGVGLANSFNARASGGVRFWTTADQTDNIGARLPANQSAWTTLSDSTRKNRYGRVDTQEILHRLSQIPIETWSYKVDPQNYRHIGPMAQDFWNAFKLGDDSLTISTIDPAGVALAAIQELTKRVEELTIQNSKLQIQVQSLSAAKQETAR